MKLVYYFFIVLLAGCASKKEVSFYSNTDNMTIVHKKQECVAPCTLTIEYDERIVARDISGKIVIEDDTSQKPIPTGNIFNLLTATTSAPTVTTALVVINNKTSGEVWRYDTNTFYIYMYKNDEYLMWNESSEKELRKYTLLNYDIMRSELNKKETPYIDRLSAVSSLSREQIEECLKKTEEPMFFADITIYSAVENMIKNKNEDEMKIIFAEYLDKDADKVMKQYKELSEHEFKEQMLHRFRLRRVFVD